MPFNAETDLPRSYWVHSKKPGKFYQGDYEVVKVKVNGKNEFETHFHLNCISNPKLVPIKFRSWQEAHIVDGWSHVKLAPRAKKTNTI